MVSLSIWSNQSVEADRSDTGKVVSVVEIVAKTLTYVKSVALAEINSTLLSNVDAKEIYWVLTVPAIWTDAAKVTTLYYTIAYPII